MLQEIKADVQSSIVPLVQGILADAQSLIGQELDLAKTEIRQEISKAKTAAVSLGMGAGLAFVAAVMFCITLVQFLLWIFPGLQPWGSYAVVTAIVAVAAFACLALGKKKAGQVSPIPHEAIDSMKENAQWLRQKI